MDPILELLNRLAAATTDEERATVQAELDAALAALTPEELAEVLAGLNAQMAEVAALPRSAETVGQMRTLRDGIVAADADTQRRETERAELDAEADRILAETTRTAEGEGEGGEGEPPTEQAPENPAEAPAPEQQAPEAVAASAAPRRRVPLSTLARAQASGTEVPSGPTRHGVPLVASVSGGGVQVGQEVVTREALGRLFSEAHRNLSRGKDRLVVASGLQPHGPEHTLGDDPIVNEQRIETAVLAQRDALRKFLGQSPEAMVAAGGFCGLPTPIYNEPSYAQRGRPMFTGFAVSFQAQRMSATHPVPMSLADIPVGNEPGDAVWRWDNATDVAALDGDDVKPCWHIECGEFITEYAEAVGICLEFGNFGQMTHPERFAKATDLADVAHDRVSETILIDAIKAKSLRNTRARTLGAAKDFFAALAILARQIRSEERTDANDPTNPTPLIWGGPSWLFEAVRIDILRSMFPGETSWDFSMERMMALFRSMNIVPTFYVDTPTGAGQIPTVADDDSAMNELPTHAEWVLALPGSHLALEGPEINVGLHRDSALNAKNNARVFSETTQGHAYIGTSKGSVWVRQELCADGSVAASIDTSDICGVTAS